MQYNFDQAIALHLDWARQFREAIAARDLTETIEHCAYDDLCGFGIWLYSLDDEIKFTPEYRAVKDLHYQFHVAASLVVAQMRARHFEAARQIVSGDFAAVSKQLVAAIHEWAAAVADDQRAGLPSPG